LIATTKQQHLDFALVVADEPIDDLLADVLAAAGQKN
jgi:hypothetical protein